MFKQQSVLSFARKMTTGKKRVESHWQIEVASDAEWDEMIQKKGLIVIDVYQEWCGPCMAMSGLLKEIKLQLGDDLLHCALAKADSITQLEKFRRRSEPTWLFLAEGDPVALIKGANAPLIRQTIMNELQQEKDVLNGLAERNIIPWSDIDFSIPVPEEEPEEREDETYAIPDDWEDKDAILLEGPYSLILDQIREAFAERSLDIVNLSKVNHPDENSESLLLWFHFHPKDEDFIEWIENVLNSAIQDAKNKTNVEETQNGEDLEEKETQDEKETQGLETGLNDDDDESAVPDIEYQLLFDASEKENFVRQYGCVGETTEEEEQAEGNDENEEEMAENENDGENDDGNDNGITELAIAIESVEQ